MKISKSRVALSLACGLFTGTAASSEFVASIDQGTRLESSAVSADNTALIDSYHVPVDQEVLIESAGVSSVDAAITVKVLDILGQHGALDVAVVTREGIVTFVGFMSSAQNLDQIIDSVQNVSGVKAIKKEALSIG